MMNINIMKKQTRFPRLSIYDIKRLTSETSPFFFKRSSLQFFGQRMYDFTVVRMKEEKLYYISAPVRDKRTGKQVGLTERYFNPKTNELTLKP